MTFLGPFIENIAVNGVDSAHARNNRDKFTAEMPPSYLYRFLFSGENELSLTRACKPVLSSRVTSSSAWGTLNVSYESALFNFGSTKLVVCSLNAYLHVV